MFTVWLLWEIQWVLKSKMGNKTDLVRSDYSVSIAASDVWALDRLKTLLFILRVD